MSFSDSLQEIVASAKLSTIDIQEQLSISRTTMWRAFSGDLSLDLLLDILRVLGLTVDVNKPDERVAQLLKEYLELRIQSEKGSKGMRPYTASVFVLDYLRSAESISEK